MRTIGECITRGFNVLTSKAIFDLIEQPVVFHAGVALQGVVERCDGLCGDGGGEGVGEAHGFTPTGSGICFTRILSSEKQRQMC